MVVNYDPLLCPWHLCLFAGGAFYLCQKCGRDIDQEIELQIRPIDNDWTGPVVRFSDRDNMYQLNTRQEAVSTAIHRRRSGQNTVLYLTTTKSYTPGDWFKLRMRVVQNRITIWWDDVLWQVRQGAVLIEGSHCIKTHSLPLTSFFFSCFRPSPTLQDLTDPDPLLIPGFAGIFITNQDHSFWRRARVVNYKPLNALCLSTYTGLSSAGQSALAMSFDAGKLSGSSSGTALNYWRGSATLGLDFYHSPYYTSFNSLPQVFTTPRGNAVGFTRAGYPVFMWAQPRYEADIDADGFTLLVAFTAGAVSAEGIMLHKGYVRGVPGWRIATLPGNLLAFQAQSFGVNRQASISSAFTPDQMTVAAFRVAPVMGDPSGTMALSASINGAPFTTLTDTTINGTSSLGMSHYLYIGSSEEMTLASRFNGMVYEMAVFKTALSDVDLAAAQTYLINKYGAGPTCPDVTPSEGVLYQAGTCSSAGNGAVCRLQCATGYRLTSGSLTLNCTAGKWSSAPAFCEATCPALSAPNTAIQGCARGVFVDGFDSNSTFSRYSVVPPAPNPWMTNNQGYLVASGGALCGDSPSAMQRLIVSSPSWQSTLFSKVRVTARVGFDKQISIHPRYISASTFYELSMSAETGIISFSAVVNSARTSLCNTSAYTTSANTWYTVKIDMSNDGQIVVDRNGQIICRAINAGVPYGSAGIAKEAQSAVTVDSFSVEALEACPSGCTNMTAGATCTLYCDPGLLPLAGDQSRTCLPNGTFTGRPLQCGYAAPIFPSLNAFVDENSAVGTYVIAANATLPANTPGSILYEIVSGNSPFNGTAQAFSIEPCSGVIRVATPSLLDYEQITGRSSYTLSIRAYVAGVTPPVETVGVATITVRNVNDPPRVVTTSCSVAENSPAGSTVCALVGADDDVPPGPMAWSITYGSGDAGSQFALEANSGLLAVKTGANLDYETTASYQLMIRVSDAGDASLYSQSLVTVSVTNVNEAPIITSPAFYEVDQSVSPLIGGLVGGPVTATDPDVGDTVSFTLAPNSLAVLNPSTKMLAFLAPRTYTNAPYETAGRLVVDAVTATLTATDSGNPSLSSTRDVTIYVIANLSATGIAVVRQMEVRPAIAAAGGGSVGGVHLINTDGSDSIYFGCTGIPTRTGDIIRLYANTTVGGVRGWNTTCSYLLTTVGAASSLNGYIVCPTSAGWGTQWGLRLTVAVDSQPAVQVPYSTVLTLSYAPPVVTSILTENPDAEVFTAGGTAMIVNGYGFGGPAAPFAASYGPCNTTVTPALCNYKYSFTRTTATHTTVRVLTSPGVGKNLRIRLTVGSQTTVPENIAFQYAHPVLYNIYRCVTNLL